MTAREMRAARFEAEELAGARETESTIGLVIAERWRPCHTGKAAHVCAACADLTTTERINA